MTGQPQTTVFVSSTWLDLEAERRAIQGVTLRMNGLRFAGMEYFGSRSTDVLETSLDEVMRSDVYVGIVGRRYGSGITELEYDRAFEAGKSCLIYVQGDTPADCPALDSNADERLGAFLQKLQARHHCSRFTTPDELAMKVSTDLHNWLFGLLLVRALARVSLDYRARIQAFVAEYIGTPARATPFGGRDAELAQLDAWLVDASAPACLLVEAGAGRGKSALLVRWTQALVGDATLKVLFFPISIRFRTNLASVFFAALTSYLAEVHGEDMRFDPDTPPEIWRGRMSDLLQRPLSNGRRLVLVLDGLDEAADWEVGPDLFPPDIGGHARVIVSARRLAGDARGANWLRRLGWDGCGSARTMSLPGLSQMAVADVLGRLSAPLSALGAREDIVHELHRLSEGDPLLVRLYVDDLIAHAPEAARLQVADLRAMSPGLDGYFERWWDDQRKLWGGANPLRERRVQVLMELLANALGPLTRDDLIGLAGEQLDSWNLMDALDILRRFIVGDGVAAGYVFSHPRLGIHWRERLGRRESASLEERFIDWCDSAVQAAEAAGAAEADVAGISAYMVQYFGAHLDRIGASVRRYRAMLTDTWRRAWVVLEGGNSGYRGDLERVMRAAERAGRGSGDLDRDLVAIAARAALCVASINQVLRATPVDMIPALVRQRLWGRVGALRYAHAIGSPMKRARALIGVAEAEDEGSRAETLSGALDALSDFLIHVRYFLDEPETSVLAPLAALVPMLPPALSSKAFACVSEITDLAARARALSMLAPRMASFDATRVLTMALALEDGSLRLELIRQVARHHPDIGASYAASPDATPWERAWMLLGMLEAADEARRPALAIRCDAACRSVLPDLADDFHRNHCRLLLDFAARAGDPWRTAALVTLVAALQNSPNANLATGELATLLSLATGALRQEVLAIARARLAAIGEATPWIEAWDLFGAAAGGRGWLGSRGEAESDFARFAVLAARLCIHCQGTGLARLRNIAETMAPRQRQRADELLELLAEPYDQMELLLPWAQSPKRILTAAHALLFEHDGGPAWRLEGLERLAPFITLQGWKSLLDAAHGIDPAIAWPLLAVLPVEAARSFQAEVVDIAASTLRESRSDLTHILSCVQAWADAAGDAAVTQLGRRLSGNQGGHLTRVFAILATRFDRDTLALVAQAVQRIDDDASRLLVTCMSALPPERVRTAHRVAWGALRPAARAHVCAHWWERGADRTRGLRDELVAALFVPVLSDGFAWILGVLVQDQPASFADDLALRVIELSVRIPDRREMCLEGLALLAPFVGDDVLRANFKAFFPGLAMRMNYGAFSEPAHDAVGQMLACAARVPQAVFLDAFDSACRAIEEGDDTGLPLPLLAKVARYFGRDEPLPLARRVMDVADRAHREEACFEAILELGFGDDADVWLPPRLQSWLVEQSSAMRLRAAIGLLPHLHWPEVPPLLRRLVHALESVDGHGFDPRRERLLHGQPADAAAHEAWHTALALLAQDLPASAGRSQLEDDAIAEIMGRADLVRSRLPPPALLSALCTLLRDGDPARVRRAAAGLLHLERTRCRAGFNNPDWVGIAFDATALVLLAERLPALQRDALKRCLLARRPSGPWRAEVEGCFNLAAASFKLDPGNVAPLAADPVPWLAPIVAPPDSTNDDSPSWTVDNEPVDPHFTSDWFTTAAGTRHQVMAELEIDVRDGRIEDADDIGAIVEAVIDVQRWWP